MRHGLQFRGLCSGRLIDGFLKVALRGGREFYIGFGDLCNEVNVDRFVPSESPFVTNILRPVGKLLFGSEKLCETYRSVCIPT